MTRLERLVAKIRARPPEADFNDVRQVLQAYGWRQDRQKGSHVAFVKDRERTFIIPLVSGRKVKRPYLDQLCERLGLDN